MNLLITAALILGTWNTAKTQYAINGHGCGVVEQGSMLVSYNGQAIFKPWYAVTFGAHKRSGMAFHTQAEATAEVERECAADYKSVSVEIGGAK